MGRRKPQRILDSGGPLPYSYAVHKGHDKNNGNPHCHLMISERVNDGRSRSRDTWFKRASKEPEKGGARKTDALKSKDWLLEVREKWQVMANKVLEKAGLESRIDHRTLKAQGIDLKPDEIKKDLKPTNNEEKIKIDLEQALRLKELIVAGMAGSNQKFNAEKARQEAEKRRARPGKEKTWAGKQMLNALKLRRLSLPRKRKIVS